ncbi:MAG: cache domain-containing protein, partial [Oceanidesulfovibrio sp.]
MMLFTTFSARLRAFVLLLGLLPIGLGMLGFSMFSRDQIIAEAHEDIAETVAFQKRLIDDWFNEQSNNMDFLAQDVAVRSRDYEATSNLFMEFMATHPEMDSLVYVNPQGRTEVDPGSATGIDVSDREYFLAAKEGRSHISEVLVGRQSGGALVIIASPVRNMKGDFGGVVFTALRMGTVDSWLAELRPGQGGMSYLIGEGDILLTDFNGAGEYERLDTIGKNKLAAMIRAAEAGEPYT